MSLGYIHLRDGNGRVVGMIEREYVDSNFDEVVTFSVNGDKSRLNVVPKEVKDGK